MIKHQTRIILAGMLGNLIESFDMAICGLLSVYLAKYLIGDTADGILLVFLTFFIGYLARPLGALVMGLFSDIYGRKIVLAISVLSMGIATATIGFVPPHSHIGRASLCILLALRVMQSFSCGGEYLNSSAYLVENAPSSSKGYTASWASFGTVSGDLVASLMALVVIHYNHTYPELEWIIWRVPFVFALLGSSIGLYIRLCVPESLEFVMYYADRSKPKAGNLFQASLQYAKANQRQTAYVFLLSCLGVTTTAQLYIYAPMQAHMYGGYTDHQIMLSNIISLLVLLAVFPIVGRLSDQINREKIVLVASCGFSLLAPPFFNVLSHGTYWQLVLSQALIAIPAGAYYATVPVMLAEMFPINLRCTVLSILYSIAASLSAGLAPLLSLLLVKKTAIAAAPALLVWVLAAAVMLSIALKQQRRSRYQTA